MRSTAMISWRLLRGSSPDHLNGLPGKLYITRALCRAMMLHRLAAPFSRLSARREARGLGASVRFGRVPAGFFPGFAEGSLSSLWMEQGLPVRGNGIFTVGSPDEKGHSTRYAPGSDAY